ncbi:MULTISPECIES: ABC transporter permease [Niastella]|uniref:ABC transporter permease n=1 Tax=Niastella soli TaxID=2821487 RepID=A0ABS3YYL2_9BACT|nr:ABC transporter permease [Niastella soli]MBO9203017.1 ABC transporter permease [Niastella soli]
MIRNYFKTACRSLKRNKGFTFLNILGLTIGLAVCLLIVFYVLDETSYDRYNSNGKRIYRVNTDTKFNTSVTSSANTAPKVAEALRLNFPEIEKTVRLLPDEGVRFQKGDELVVEKNALYCDPTVFDIFTLPMLEGDPHTALTEPHTVVISERMAEKYFNTTHVLGRVLVRVGDNNRNSNLKITGVIKDLPVQSHFEADVLESMISDPLASNENLAAIFPFHTYLLLKPHTDHKALEAKFPAFLKKYLDFIEEMEKQGDYIKLNLTPLFDIHLQSNRSNELGANGNIQYIYIYSGVALFILLLACINFMNLSTAHSANRAKEVGVRKVLGSSRMGLVLQFISESMLMSFFATVAAILLAWALLPFFNQISGKTLALTSSTFVWLLPAITGITLVVGLLAGSYPAFFLSAFMPVKVLKGKTAAGIKGNGLRSLLVIFQFSISIFLIIGTLIIYNQLNYMQHKSLGFNRKQVLLVKQMNVLNKQANVFKQEMLNLPGVTSATLSSFMPTAHRRWSNYVTANNNVHQTEFWPVDEDYLRTLNISLDNGRDFNPALSSDSSAVIINQTAARSMGFAGDAIDKTIAYGTNQKQYHIIGVVKDFNFNSLRDNITPVVLTMTTPFERKKQGDGPDVLAIKLNTGELPVLMSLIEKKWKAFSKDQAFDYSFMDEDFDGLYRAEQRTGKIAILFTTLAIFIACLGLFGLAAYTAEQRTREIGIRKVLGANVADLVTMLAANFMKLVFIAFLVAVPLAWLFMNKWLQGFAYRESISWWVFITAGLGAFLLALVTIISQFIRAAIVNPVQSLKVE